MKGISLFHLADVSGLIGKEILLDRVRQGLKTLCFGDKIGVDLETLLDTVRPLNKPGQTEPNEASLSCLSA